MTKAYKILSLLLITLTIAPWAFATDEINLRQDPQILQQLQESRSSWIVAQPLILQNALGMGPDISLKLLRKSSDRSSLTHSRYLMLYKGIPVWARHVILTEDQDSRTVRLHGTAVRGIEIENVEPAFDAETALEEMKSLQRSRSDSRDAWHYENETSELVIFVDQETPLLSYAVTFFADVDQGGEPTRPTFIVDAHSGDVVLEFEGLTTGDGIGPGGNTKTGQYQYGTDYPPFIVEQSNGTSRMTNQYANTIDMNHSSWGGSIFSYQTAQNTHEAINGAFSPLNDAHYFAQVIFLMFNDWYGLAPLNFKLTMRVHYSRNYENAFWNGSSMTFGDGATRFFPLVSLDVSAHEVSHGFTEQNSSLVYRNQSGGINESFSDMAGEAAEYYMEGDNDWMVGAQIFKSNGALRYLDDPVKDGRSIDTANNYYDGLDVHYSSGVYNKAFHALATTNGWNTKKAFDVFVKANTDYWSPNTTFVSGAQGVCDAASDYGYSEADVKAAFSVVDIIVP